MEIKIPDLEWYNIISDRKNVQARCPFSTVEACPRYYQSLFLLGYAGSTSIEPAEDKRLKKFWENSDLWPRTKEYATSIMGPDDNPSIFSNFCPETAYDRFGYFASFLSEYADDIDRGIAHKRLEAELSSPNDWRWNWSALTPQHFTDCDIYSVLDYRNKESNLHPAGLTEDKKSWYERPLGLIIIGVIITIIGGLLLRYLL